MAAAEGVLDKIDFGDSVLSAFMQENSSIGHWVGTYPGELKRDEGTLHTVRIYSNDELGLLIAGIKLFSFSQTPDSRVRSSIREITLMHSNKCLKLIRHANARLTI